MKPARMPQSLSTRPVSPPDTATRSPSIEAARYGDGERVVAGAQPVGRAAGVHEVPVELAVGLELLDQLGAGLHALALDAVRELVLVDDGNRDLAGSAVGV